MKRDDEYLSSRLYDLYSGRILKNTRENLNADDKVKAVITLVMAGLRIFREIRGSKLNEDG